MALAGVIEVIECHESVTIVHTTRMRVSRIRDNRPLSINDIAASTNWPYSSVFEVDMG